MTVTAFPRVRSVEHVLVEHYLPALRDAVDPTVHLTTLDGKAAVHREDEGHWEFRFATVPPPGEPEVWARLLIEDRLMAIDDDAKFARALHREMKALTRAMRDERRRWGAS